MIPVLHLLLFLYLWWYFFYRRESRFTAFAMFLSVGVKLLAGLAVTSIYQSKYGGGDMHGYMRDAALFNDLFHQAPVSFLKLIFLGDDSGELVKETLMKSRIWFDSGYRLGYNDAQTVIRFHALLSLLSGLNLPVHLLWSNVLCMLGLWWMFITIIPVTSSRHKMPLLCWLIVCMPDFLVWSSPVLKEPLLIFIMGACIRSLRFYFDKPGLQRGVVLALSLAGFLLVKNFWMLLFLPGVIMLMIFPSSFNKPKQMLAGYILAGLLVFLAGIWKPSLHLPSLLFGQQLNMWRFAIYEQAGSLIEPVPFAPVWWSVIRHLPYSFMYGLMLPLPTWPCDLMTMPFAIENLIVFVLLMVAFVRMIRHKIEPDGFLVMLVLAGAGILIISAMTTPVVGSLIRFKLPGVLLLVLVALSVLYTRKLPVKSV